MLKAITTTNEHLSSRRAATARRRTREHRQLRLEPLEDRLLLCGPDDPPQSGPDITQAIVDHLNDFIQQNQGNLSPFWPSGAADLADTARENGHNGDFGNAIGDNPSGTVTLGDMVISQYHIDHILIMVYIAESYGEETARSAGQYQESFWLGFFTEGSEFEGSSNAQSNADLKFNEIAIKISEKLKHADANGGAVDLLTVEEVLEITQAVSEEDRQAIAEKPAKNPEGTTGYDDHQTSDQEIDKPGGLELPPIDL